MYVRNRASVLRKGDPAGQQTVAISHFVLHWMQPVAWKQNWGAAGYNYLINSWLLIWQPIMQGNWLDTQEAARWALHFFERARRTSRLEHYLYLRDLTSPIVDALAMKFVIMIKSVSTAIACSAIGNLEQVVNTSFLHLCRCAWTCSVK